MLQVADRRQYSGDAGAEILLSEVPLPYARNRRPGGYTDLRIIRRLLFYLFLRGDFLRAWFALIDSRLYG